jgi:hypothetical protein
LSFQAEHINNCKEATVEYSEHIEYICSDSVTHLKSLSSDIVNNIDLLYLDSFDLNIPDPIPSQIPHLRELLAVYDNLSNNILIGIDDNLMPGNWIEWKWPSGEVQIMEADKIIIGKGTLVDRFLRDRGWIRFNDQYPYSLLGYRLS